MTELGRLVRVDDLRTVWESESQSFTPWLAQDENISVLAETLGMGLEVEAQEKKVGPFRADILCRDANSPDQEAWVLIENQLRPTDHTHLGQLLTYAAGLRTAVIIWVAQRFTDEHRAALDWLNEITNERYRFFGLEIELWRIGDSLAAPKFNIVSKPNDSTRQAEAAKSTTIDTELGESYQHYWAAFIQYLKDRDSQLATKKEAKPNYWLNYSIGRANFWLSAVLRRKDRLAYVCLHHAGPHRSAHYDLLKKRREEIEAELGEKIEWHPESKGAPLRLTYPGEVDLNAEGAWPRQHEWLANTLEKFNRVFRPLVRDLDVADWTPEEASDSDEE